jgi:hypothetical protein
MATAARKVQPARKTGGRRVLMRAMVYTPEGAFTVWIRDISSSGAEVTSESRLPVGCDVIVKRGDLFAAAHVARSSASGAGIEFYRALSEAEIDSAMTAAIAH